MIEIYGLGVLIAFFLGILKLLLAINETFSIRAKNYKKIGMYYKWIDGGYTGTDPLTIFDIVWYLIFSLGLGSALSWITVVDVTYSYLKAKKFKNEMPEKLKEMQFKISHLELSKEQIIQLRVEGSQFLGENLPIHTGNPDRFVLSNSNGYRVVVWINPSKKEFTYYSSVPDNDGDGINECLYAFDDNKILFKTLNDYLSGYSGKNYRVKDGIVLENEFRLGYEKYQMESKEKVDEWIEELRKSVTWQEMQRSVIRYFIYSHHPEVVSPAKLSAMIRQELLELNDKISIILSEAKKIGFIVNETEEGYYLSVSKECGEDEKVKLNDQYEAKIKTQFPDAYILLGNKKITESHLKRLLVE